MKPLPRFSQPGSCVTGKLTGGVLLAASGLFSRIRRWAMSATGMRMLPTHGNEGPPAQPNPVAGPLNLSEVTS